MVATSLATCFACAYAWWKKGFAFLAFAVWGIASSGVAADYKSHPAMRPLPAPMEAELTAGPKRFVDSQRGDDGGPGSLDSPWKTLRAALPRLRPGDTLYLRGGAYYESIAPRRSGMEGAPITIASYPGELAVIDGGVRDFAESPESSWEPYPDGAPGEYVSSRTFEDADARRAPIQFLPGAWEPMWGLEEERPLALGFFSDSMVPLHGYRLAVDLRAKNELWIRDKRDHENGIYCGPGLWFNRQTNRIHIRLAHHHLAGLGARAYRGETDPRKMRLHVAVGFGDEVVRLTGIRHWRLQGLVLRGATGCPLLHMYGCQDVEIDHMTLYGGFPALMVNASQDVRVTNSAFRGLAAPWSSRAHMKYRGVASYQVILQDDQPLNENIEFSSCEFTDDHDFAFLQPVKNLQFHHNYVDNYNDDGLECGPKLREHTMFIYQNHIGRCLIPLTQHQIKKDESPLDHDPEAGVFFFRNIVDLRGGVYTGPPVEPDPAGAFLRREGHLVGDHGSPTWPVMHIYHNTFLRDTPVFRDYYLFGLGAAGLRNTERDVFNNIFVQTSRLPGLGFAGKQPGAVREGGNLLWGLQLDAKAVAKFKAFRNSPLFDASREQYEAGFTTHDSIGDPRFVRLSPRGEGSDLRLRADSPAIDFGRALPDRWPDPLREQDKLAPDAGAIPKGGASWGVGVDRRLSVFHPERD